MIDEDILNDNAADEVVNLRAQLDQAYDDVHRLSVALDSITESIAIYVEESCSGLTHSEVAALIRAKF